jgi:hypothetical protein
MTRSRTIGLALLIATVAWSAETVTATSRAFSFPLTSSASIAPEQRSADVALRCHAVRAGQIVLAWHMDGGLSHGSVTVTTLAGAVVKRCAVSSPDGSVALGSAGPHASSLYLVTLSSGGVRKTVTVLAQ